jgi:hypothetical protein
MLNFPVRALIQNILIDPSILRLLWSIAANIHPQDLSTLPDRELSKRILQEVDGQLALNEDQQNNLLSYLHSKMMLIRDMAD